MVKYLIGGAAGAVLGYLYYYFVGCATGACPITANPVSATVYGLVLGLLLAGAFVPSRGKKT